MLFRSMSHLVKVMTKIWLFYTCNFVLQLVATKITTNLCAWFQLQAAEVQPAAGGE